MTTNTQRRVTSTSNNKWLREGESFLKIRGGKVWYKISGKGSGIPVVLLHGGPGGSSKYLEIFEQLGNQRQVIRYDQFGSGKSDVVKDTSFFTINHFVAQLDLLRLHLGIQQWHIYGHSWGAILAMEYYRKFPYVVNSLTLASPALDAEDWSESTQALLSNLPEKFQNAIKNAESTGNTEDPLYVEGMNLFYDKYVWGSNPPQADLENFMATFNTDLYNYMWGPSEFMLTGTLKNYSAVSLLSKIEVPVLFTVGEFDEISPQIVMRYAQEVKNVKYVEFQDACHLTSWYAPDKSIKVQREFLNKVDSDNP